MKTKEQLLTELNTFKPTKRLIAEEQFGVNEYNILSYIIGGENLKQMFGNVSGSSSAQEQSFYGIRWLKQKLEAWNDKTGKTTRGNKHFALPGPHRELMLSLNGKIDPAHPNVGTSVKDILTFAKEVADGVNAITNIGEQWKEAKHDLDTVQGYPKAQARAQQDFQRVQDAFIKISQETTINLSHVIDRIEYFTRLFENTIALEKLNKVVKAYNNLDWGRKSIMETQYIMELFTPHIEGHYTSQDIEKYLKSNFSQKIVDHWLQVEAALMTVKFQGDTGHKYWNLAYEADLDVFNIMFEALPFEAIDIQSLHGVTYWKTIPTDPMHHPIND